ncbi:hypothetical protein [Streptomyces sp. NPDC048665]|uniref:hypothetical protein n=1 Tax=Streptomyces sp. NPDC048665 TaxID=3155490 RepID=UPI00343F440D
MADRVTALGGVWEESAAEYLTRRAIVSELPRLLSRWEDESDAVRFALPAPAGSSRADVVSLKAARPNVDPENLGRAVLPVLVVEDVGPEAQA